jgi:hypothetical protein
MDLFSLTQIVERINRQPPSMEDIVESQNLCTVDRSAGSSRSTRVAREEWG